MAPNKRYLDTDSFPHLKDGQSELAQVLQLPAPASYPRSHCFTPEPYLPSVLSGDRLPSLLVRKGLGLALAY